MSEQITYVYAPSVQSNDTWRKREIVNTETATVRVVRNEAEPVAQDVPLVLICDGQFFFLMKEIQGTIGKEAEGVTPHRCRPDKAI